jgi:hypothetical protein
LVTEDDLEAFIKHLASLGRAASTRNHYVQLIKAMSKWAVRKGYRGTPLIAEDSDVVRRKKEAQRNRRLEPDEEEKLLRAAKPHLRALIIAALESCCREGELLTLQWTDVSLARDEMTIRAENAKDREDRTIPISSRLRWVFEVRRHDADGRPFPPSAYVFGNEVGRRVGSVKRAWQTTVLKAHGHEPVWIWTKKKGPPTTRERRSSVPSHRRRTDRSICTFTIFVTREVPACSKPDGRHTMFSTCWAMRRFNRPARTSTQRSEGCTNQCEPWSNPARLASLLQANLPAAAGLLASRLPPVTGTP